MNKKIWLPALLLLSTLALFAQSKNLEFTTVEIDGPLVVDLIAGTTNAIEVTREADLVTWEINGDALVIVAQRRPYHDTPVVRVTVAQLEALEVTSAVVLKGEGVFAHRKLSVTATAQSTIDLEIDAEELRVSARGQSVINLSGKADELHLAAEGQSVLGAREVSSGLIDVTAREQSVVKINTENARVTKDVSGQSIVEQ